MSKAAIVYWSGTGNTELMAQKVLEGARAAGAEALIFQAADFSADKMDEFDATAFGCPSMGAEQLEESEFEPMFTACRPGLRGKKIALFGSYGWGDGDWMRTWEADCRADGAQLLAEPVICNEIVWGTGFSMYSVIMGHLGSDAVAANSIASIVKNLAGCFCMGLGNGGGIMVGNELGAGKLEKAKEYGRRLCHLSVSSGIVSGLVLLAFSPLILRVANLSVTAEGYLKGMLLICAYYMIGRSVNGVTISGIFCAGGDSKFGLYCDCISMWCIMVPLGLIAAFVLKLPVLAVYFIISLDEFVKIPAVYLNYKKYRWVKDLTVKTE